MKISYVILLDLLNMPNDTKLILSRFTGGPIPPIWNLEWTALLECMMGYDQRFQLVYNIGVTGSELVPPAPLHSFQLPSFNIFFRKVCAGYCSVMLWIPIDYWVITIKKYDRAESWKLSQKLTVKDRWTHRQKNHSKWTSFRSAQKLQSPVEYYESPDQLINNYCKQLIIISDEQFLF